MSRRAAYIRLIKNGRTGKITKMFVQPLAAEVPSGAIIHSARMVFSDNGLDPEITVYDVTGEVRKMVDNMGVEDA